MNSLLDAYLDYLKSFFPPSTLDNLSHFIAANEKLNWSEPKTSIEFNNYAVMALIEAETTEDLSMRSLYLETALDALNQGIEQDKHPLCLAHLALTHYLIGEPSISGLAFSYFLELLNDISTQPERPLGLIYLPPKLGNLEIARQEVFIKTLQSQGSYEQALILLASVLYQSQLAFYTSNGLRFLQLADQVNPNSVALYLQLGLACLINLQWEGLTYLQKAIQIAPNYSPVLQALYLTYRETQQQAIAEFWHQKARANRNLQTLEWRWTELSLDSPFTYLPFEDDLLLAVEPSFKSYVTSVLLAQGDWFEKEMELWRTQIQPGMTVIDVGANVGVYAFSAAKRVTKTGKVLAVEPFSGCLQCLEETCRVNQFSWVEVCQGAASNHQGTAHLSLNSANELNEVITDEMALKQGQYETISCFTLDSLIEQYQLTRVDWLKIDAEGHEVQVLEGSERILTEFAPIILYENIAGDKGSNLAVAEYLLNKGYNLFRYRPYLQELIPLESLDDLRGHLNVIALPQR